MKVLITGGLGQIGSHVAELLINRGDEVFVIDNLATGREEHLKNFDNLKIYIKSIADPDFIYSIVSKIKPDIIVHAAGSYKDPNDWYNDTLTNCVGGSIIVDVAKNKVKRFIYFQTALCYGLKPLTQPIKLDHPINPKGSSYAISKTTNELYLELSG